MQQENKPLSGYRVLDLTNVLSGPFACHQLAYMGAEVIKVEARNGGDLARQLGADAELNQRFMGVSFLAQNSGKQSITVDLKKPLGKQLFRDLVATADVVVENFRPGVMQRLGLGFEALSEIKPDLIYCAISGFGQTGPLKDLPAYDQIIQGMSGVMSITGDAEHAPYRVGYPVADTIGGMTAAFAIAAALAQRGERKAQMIDVSMLEATMATMGWAVSNLLVANKEPKPMGNDNVTASPSGAFHTQDGLINIAANKQEQFEALCAVLGHPEWSQDERFAVRQSRLQNRDALTALIESVLATQSTQIWWDKLIEAGVPSGPVYSVKQALESAHLHSRDTTIAFENVPGVGRDVQVLRTGFHLNGEALSVDCPPPQLGEHTDQILASLGYSNEQIHALKEQSAI